MTSGIRNGPTSAYLPTLTPVRSIAPQASSLPCQSISNFNGRAVIFFALRDARRCTACLRARLPLSNRAHLPSISQLDYVGKLRDMGASHAVISLGDLSRSSFDDEYFRSAGITWPEGLRGARNPTPRELRRVLRSLGGYHIEYDATGHSLDVTISNSMDAQDWAVIWVENYAGEASE